MCVCVCMCVHVCVYIYRPAACGVGRGGLSWRTEDGAWLRRRGWDPRHLVALRNNIGRRAPCATPVGLDGGGGPIAAHDYSRRDQRGRLQSGGMLEDGG